MLNKLIKEIQKLKNPTKAKIHQQFFKTSKGEYGEGDKFLGLVMGQQRTLAKKYSELKLTDIQKLLDSKIHEHRMTALLILVEQYTKTIKHKIKKSQKQIYNFYLKNTKNINNWDLVDVTTPKIVGHYLLDKNRKILYKLAKSKNLWEKRISILATFTFIRNNQLKDTLAISKILLFDEHDLIHKAVGWMLREVGKKDLKTLEIFLKKYYLKMPRAMLRYAIEKFPEPKRQKYLKGNI